MSSAVLPGVRRGFFITSSRILEPITVLAESGGAAGEPQTDFYATADQALFFANGSTVRGWLNTLSARLNKIAEPKPLAEELYLTILTRRPTAEENALVEKLIGTDPKVKNAAIQDIAWGLITSSEFRFNH